MSAGPVAAALQVGGLRNNSGVVQIWSCRGWALPQPRASGNGARLCPPDQSQRLRKSGDSETIPTSCKFRGAAAGLCHSRAPDNPKGIASPSPRLARQRLPWVNSTK